MLLKAHCDDDLGSENWPHHHDRDEAPAVTRLSDSSHDPIGPDDPSKAMPHHPTLVELRSGQCRFPLGGPLEPARFFCGKPALALRPYCAECCQRAYVVTRAKR
jgi:hypothetical protein